MALVLSEGPFLLYLILNNNLNSKTVQKRWLIGSLKQVILKGKTFPVNINPV